MAPAQPFFVPLLYLFIDFYQFAGNWGLEQMLEQHLQEFSSITRLTAETLAAVFHI